MAKPTLIIANKNYSSWSLRPWLALTEAGIDFKEVLVPFGQGFRERVLKTSKAGLVPVLKHNGLVIWDSIAILEYAAETWPEKNLWPKNAGARAHARSICAEFHAGFRALRSACPMNLHRKPAGLQSSASVMADIKRLEEIWASTRKKFGKGGPFLFGKFGAADAMYAPVATRIVTYKIPVSKLSQAYIDAVLGTKSFQKWKQSALKEKWYVPEDEVDHKPGIKTWKR